MSSILYFKRSPETFEVLSSNNGMKNFTDRKVPVRRAIAIMAKNNIQIYEDEAAVILDLLYRISKTYNLDKIKKSAT